MGYCGWGQGMVSDNATGIQPIDFGEVRSLDFSLAAETLTAIVL